jgi:RHS repeat-associated protein
MSLLLDGIDHPLRIKVAATNTTAYYEVDLAGNVRGLRASGGASLGGYRYSAFGQTLEDTTSITQPLRWKGRWFSPVAGGTYDMRARQRPPVSSAANTGPVKPAPSSSRASPPTGEGLVAVGALGIWSVNILVTRAGGDTDSTARAARNLRVRGSARNRPGPHDGRHAVPSTRRIPDARRPPPQSARSMSASSPVRAQAEGRARTWGRQPAKPAGWGHLCPDGHTRTQLYDELGRITSRCYGYSLGTTRCYTAQYDAVGNPIRMGDPDGADVLEYDALDRLKKVTREVGGVPGEVDDYDYNALGALKVNAGIALNDQRPRLDGAGSADAAVPATVGGEPVTLDLGGRVTSLRGATFTWSRDGLLRDAQDPIPAEPELYGVDSHLRRFAKIQGSNREFYVFEGLDRVATLDESGALKEGYLFDGIDHPLRIKVAATNTTAYYEVDLAGNVRGLRASGGTSLGGYRYSAFGQTLEDTSSITQSLRWKGRWFSPVAGGTYDVRARQWSPELGVFLSIDELEKHDAKSTLWGWPGQNPIRFDDPDGRGYSPYRDKAPLGPGPAWCISNTTLYSGLRRTCCAFMCFNQSVVGGTKGTPRILDTGAFASCMEQCDPSDPDAPNQCR